MRYASQQWMLQQLAMAEAMSMQSFIGKGSP